MTTAKEYVTRADQVLKTISDSRGEITLTWESVPEARLHQKQISQVQKELRLIKKEIGLEVKAIRGVFTAEKADVGKPGFGKGIMQGLFGKKAVGKMNVGQREDLRKRQASELTPYESVTKSIDNALIQLDRLKVQLDKWIVDHKE